MLPPSPEEQHDSHQSERDADHDERGLPSLHSMQVRHRERQRTQR
jgi:hypothetical protein